MKQLLQKVFPKKRFQGKEPKLFLKVIEQQQAKRRRWWTRPVLTAFVVGLILIQWRIAKQDPSKSPPTFNEMLPLAVLGGTLLTYGLPWVVSKCPSYIRVRDNHIARTRGNTTRFWKFRDLASYEWLERPEFFTLVLHRKKGDAIFIGVPQDVDANSVRAFLCQKGLSNSSRSLSPSLGNSQSIG